MASSGSVVAVCVVCGLPLLYLAARTIVRPKPIPGIPHNPLIGALGDIPSIAEYVRSKGEGALPWFSEQAEKHGPIYQVFMPFRQRVVVVSDPHEIEDILIRRQGDFGQDTRMKEAFKGAVPHGMIALPTNQMWKKHRRLLGPAMTSKYLEQMTPRISKNIQNLIRLWDRKRTLMDLSGDASAFAAAPDLHLAMMDSIGNITFGEGFGGIQNAIDHVAALSTVDLDDMRVARFSVPTLSLHKSLRLFFEGARIANETPLPWLTWMLFRLKATWKPAYQLVSSFLDEKVKQAREKALELQSIGADLEKADCVVDMVVQREKKEGEPMPDEEFKDELTMFILAGQDTTAAVMSWAVKILARNPEVQRKLHMSLLETLENPEGRPLTWKDVQGTSYLDAVVAEILRHSLAVGAVIREAIRETSVLSHVIPKGTRVFLLLHHAAMDATVATEATRAKLDPVRTETSRAARAKTLSWRDNGHEFDPERWIDANGKFDGRQGWSLPFSAGQRGCFGQKLAILQLKLLIASLNLAFFFDEVPPELDGNKVNIGIVQHPVDCYVRPRLWSSKD